MSYSKDPIIAHYESCLEKYGDTCRGVDWPNEEDARKRYDVMLDMVKRGSILDFGCGTGAMFRMAKEFDYTGYDISEKMIAVASAKYPAVKFTSSLALVSLSDYDYVIMNGVLTEKQTLTFEQMWNRATDLLELAWKMTKVGLAFNVMSCNVDWERDDLFHCPMDMLTEFITERMSRKFVIRQDYGLFEYTVYVYK